MKRFIMAVLILSMVALFTNGCADKAPDEKVISIGIVQIVEHPALDAAREGFIDALASKGYVDKQNIRIDYKNANGEPATCLTISESFVADKVDLILAIATPALQAAANSTSTIPIVFTAVTDPVAAGAVQSWERPGNNITGFSDLTPTDEQLNLLLEIVPNAKNIGVIYNSGEVNSVVQVEMLRKVAASKGLNLVESVATNTGEVGTAAEALIGKVDAIFLPLDNTTASAFDPIRRVAEEFKIPTIAGGAEGYTDSGALASIGIGSYYDLGYSTGLLAAEILGGANPAEIPVRTAETFTYAINTTTATKIGITLPKALIDRAEKFE